MGCPRSASTAPAGWPSAPPAWPRPACPPRGSPPAPAPGRARSPPSRPRRWPARYGRSLQDLIAMVGELRKRGIGFTSLHERLDATTPGGRLVFHVFAALAEFIRELIVSGTREGLAAARARGKVGGRPTVVNADIIRAARDMLPNPEHSITSIAKLLGVSPGTLYNHIPDLQELRTGRVPSQLEAGTR
ncbi:recombinase family protein [Kitasatospora purpeofusca]|uniref:recombinase family protein n=1 Tax=Kitasatospora purpeofusca TaxID=67352 RepID=UPI0035E0D232